MMIDALCEKESKTDEMRWMGRYQATRRSFARSGDSREAIGTQAEPGLAKQARVAVIQ